MQGGIFMLKQILIVASVAVALSGCASTAVKNAASALGQRDLAYGSILVTKPMDMEVMKSSCAKQSNPAWDDVCHNLAGYEQAQLAILHSSRIVTSWVVIPLDWHAQQYAVVQVNPKRAAIGTKLAAAKPQEGCQWTGFPLEHLNSRTGMAAGFAMGMLIVPAVAVAADDHILEGGVECEGWSYKSLLSANSSAH